MPFLSGLIYLSEGKTIALGITLLFARYKGVSLEELGLRKISLKVLAIVSITAVSFGSFSCALTDDDRVITILVRES